MRTDQGKVLALLVCGLVAVAPRAALAGLCGDSSGDGYFNTTDALATLRLAVGAGYDRRGDVAPLGSPAGDGKLTAGDALESLRATVQGRIPRCHGANASRAAVTTAPYDFFSSGGFAVVDLATRAVKSRGGAISGDAVIRTPSNTPVVVNRKNFNSLQYLNPALPTLPNIKECSVSDGIDSNPQDVALISPTKGYVTLYAGASLLIFSPPVLFDPKLDPSCGTMVTGHIDLSAFDSDGIPEMDQMLVVGSDLFVSLQLLNKSLQPKGPGTLAVIDTATDTVKGSIPLSFDNPFATTKGLWWDEFQQRIFVGGPGTVGDVLDDGGIEAIDPIAMESAAVVLTGEDIHANLFDFVIVGTRRAYAIVADLASNSVVEIDLKQRKVVHVLLSSLSLITDIEMTETGELWVAYRGETAEDAPGVRIFRVTDNVELTVDAQLQPKPIALGQAPFTLAFFE